MLQRTNLDVSYVKFGRQRKRIFLYQIMLIRPQNILSTTYSIFSIVLLSLIYDLTFSARAVSETNQEYHCFLANTKTTFDSSERARLQSELACARQKLCLLDTDAAMRFLEIVISTIQYSYSFHLSFPSPNK